MDTALLIEIFGYIGSALVVVSMLMSSIVKLRVVNTIGSIVSGTYALIVGAFPLVLMNGCLIVINVYNLFKLLNTNQTYDLIDTTTNDAVVDYFIHRYSNDIQSFFPDFTITESKDKKAYVVCCDGKPAGVLVGEEKEGIFDILIDYSTPEYRDCSVGTFLYAQLASKDIHEVVFSHKLHETHKDYINKVGFVKVNDKYIKKLDK